MALYDHGGVASQVPKPIAEGGTGSSTAATALNAILPSQTSNSGKVLTTDGTNASWGAAGSSEVTGPGSATDRAVAIFNGTTGKIIQNTGVLIDAANGITLPAGQTVNVRVVTAAGAVTAAATDFVIVVNKTVGAATTVNLPATPATGLMLTIKDGKGDAGTNNITVTPAAGNIDGAATLVMSVNYQSVKIVYNATQWNVV